MSMTDPVADMLTRIRNACGSKHRRVDIPASKLKLEIARLLKENNFIQDFRTVPSEAGKPLLREALAVLVSDDDFFSGKVTVTSSEQQEHLAGSGAIAIARERGLVKTLKVARA